MSYDTRRWPRACCKQTNWGLQALQSFRAPAGTLDKRMPMFCVIAKSMYVNPKWARLTKQINDKMLADFNQKLKQGYDQLAAAQAIVEQTMQQQAAFQANFDKQEEAFRNSGGVRRQLSTGWRHPQRCRPLGRFDPRRRHGQRSQHRRYDAALQPGPVSLHRWLRQLPHHR